MIDQTDHHQRLFIWAFLAHLIIPLLLFVDIMLAWIFPTGLASINPPGSFWYSFGATGQFAFVVSGLWIAVGLACLILSTRIRLFDYRRLYGPLVTAFSFLILLGILEAGLQISSAGENKPALWPPGQEALLEPDPELVPGIRGAGTFTGNNVGLRGLDYPVDDSIFKIIAVGGSTTESLYLDDTEEWSRLLMDRLNLKQDDIEVWAANAGQSGRNTIDHRELLSALPVLSEADLLVFLVGINDLQPSLSMEGASTQEFLDLNAEEFIRQVRNGGKRLRPTRPYFKRTELFNLLKRSSANIIDEIAPASVLTRFGVGPGSYFAVKRKQRQSADIVALPDLTIGLNEYRERLILLADECDISKLRCLFVTQPSMWRTGLPEYEKSLLWFGWVRGVDEPFGYLSVSDLAVAMDRYNQTLLDLCIDADLDCFDLAAVVPKDTTAFFDDVHFNENGSRIVADSLSDYLLTTSPFATQTP